MDTAMLIEIFGYIGSTLVVVSMLMASVVKLRLINTVGSIISLIYAFICGAFPLVLMNGCLIVINVYNLFKLLKTKAVYDLVSGQADDACVGYFMNRYNDDIKTYFPAFNKAAVEGEKAYVIYCDGNPAGVLIGKEENGVFDATIDYTTPAYRDCSVGTYLYSELPKAGIKKIVFSQSASDVHADYLNKMAFTKENNSYVKNL